MDKREKNVTLPDFDSLPVVHNVWAVHTDGKTSVAETSRPQDWGDPRWHYRVYRISAPHLGHTAIMHCWISARFEQEHLYANMFAPLILMILLPGTPVEECGRDFLREDDFWMPEWGVQPPYFERDKDDFDWRDWIEPS